MTVSYIFYIIF